MSENLLLSLQITALGMGLVFAAIILLSLMMSLLTRFTGDKESESDSAEAGSPAAGSAPSEGGDHKARAAAIAVAIAFAEQAQAQPIPEPPTAFVSAWQLGMRTRQLYQKGNPSPAHRAR